MLRKIFYTFVLFFAFNHGAYANLSLDKVVIEFDSKSRPVENIKVTNSGDKDLKVTAKIVEVLNSGTDEKEEIDTKHLSVAPSGFELKAGEEKLVRVVHRRKPGEEEYIYRIRFHPDAPERVHEQSAGDTTVKIGVITAMGALVLVKPTEAKPDLQYSRTANSIVFENKGNVTVQVQREDHCNDDESVCETIYGKRIYPNSTWELELPEFLKTKEFTQTVLINGEYKNLTFKAP